MSTTVPGSARVPTQHSPASAAAEDRHVDLDAPRPAPPRTGTTAVRDAVHAVLCAVAGVLITLGFAFDPSKEADSGAELLAVVADSPERFYWSSTLSAFGLVLVAAVGLAVMRLVRGRGRVVATVGGLLLVMAGPAAAAGQFMYGAVVTAMVESGQDRADMAALQDSLGTAPEPASPSSSASRGSCSGCSCARQRCSSRGRWRAGCRRSWSPASSR